MAAAAAIDYFRRGIPGHEIGTTDVKTLYDDKCCWALAQRDGRESVSECQAGRLLRPIV